MKMGIKLSKFDLLQEAVIGIFYVCCWEMFGELWSIDQRFLKYETWNLPMWYYCTLNSNRNQLTVKSSKILTLSIRQSKSIWLQISRIQTWKIEDTHFWEFWEKVIIPFKKQFWRKFGNCQTKNITNESWEVWNWKLVYYCGGAWQRNKENDGKKASNNCQFWEIFWVFKLKNFRTPTFKNFKKKSWYHSGKWSPENFGKFLTKHVETKVD